MNHPSPKAATGRHRLRPCRLPILAALLAGAWLASAAPTRADVHAASCEPKKLESPDTISLSALPGRLVYVDFWASWCVPCKQSFPFMNTLKSQFEAKGVSILAISVDKDIDEARAFLRENPAKFQIALDASGRCAKRFAVKGMPSSYIVSKTGEILYTHKGFRPSDTAEITRQLQSFIEKLKE